MATTDNFTQTRENSLYIKSKKYYFFAGFLAISFITAFLIGGFILGNEKNNQEATTEISEQVKIDSNSLPNNPNSWTTYQIKTVGIEFKLPEKITKENGWKEKEKPGKKGSILCFSNQISDGAVCEGDIFTIGGTSVNFEEGREGLFIDLQGFTKENSKYFVNSIGGNKIELKNVKFRNFTNKNGIEIIKVLGENQIIDGSEFPISGTPGKGYIGAIVNTKNSKYPGISIQLHLNSNISEYEFDLILESLKFLN